MLTVTLSGPGIDNLGPEAGAQTTASSTGCATALKVYGLHCFSFGQPHIYAFGMAHRQEVAGSQTWSAPGSFASVLGGIAIHGFRGHSSSC